MAIAGGSTVVMLSAVDGPPGPSVAAVHGAGRPHPWLPHLVRGDRLYGDHRCDRSSAVVKSCIAATLHCNLGVGENILIRLAYHIFLPIRYSIS